MRGYDSWKTSGRYSKDEFTVVCPSCETETPVVSETEYGTTEWTPAECKCGHEFTGEEQTLVDEPDYDAIRDQREWEINNDPGYRYS